MRILRRVPRDEEIQMDDRNDWGACDGCGLWVVGREREREGERETFGV